MPFKDQVVVVTGGTRGIGAAITRRFLEEGATVLATYHSNSAAAHGLMGSLGALKEKLQVIKCDISDRDSVDSFFIEFDKIHSRLHVLVNNAGIRMDHVLGMMPEAAWDQVIAVNLTGTFLMTKAAIQRMSSQRYGRIIQITSPSRSVGFPGQGNYAASKAGQVGLTRSLAKELATRNITVNCVSPGFIATELLNDLKDPVREEYKNRVPMRRFGTPEEVAYAVLVLASPKASYINGAILDVTGGL